MKVEVYEGSIGHAKKSLISNSIIYSTGLLSCSAIVAVNSNEAFMAHAKPSRMDRGKTETSVENVFSKLTERARLHNLKLEDLTIGMHFGDDIDQEYLLNQADALNLTIGYAAAFRVNGKNVVSIPRAISYNVGKQELRIMAKGCYEDKFQFSF